jgi:hypothetical protein
MRNHVVQGRNKVIIIIVILLGVTLAGVFLRPFNEGPRFLASIRFLGSAILALALYRGFQWARWTLVISICLVGILSLVGGLGSINFNDILGVTSTVVGVAYLVIAGILIFSKDVRTFLDYRRQDLFHEDT